MFNRTVRWRRYRRRVVFQQNHHLSRKPKATETILWTKNKIGLESSSMRKILGNNSKIYVRRKPDERLLPECLGDFGDWELTFCYVLGCISYHGISNFHQLTAIWTLISMFLSNFDDHLRHVVAQHFPYRPWIFLEDNAPWCVSARANAWKSIKNTNTLSCLAQI